MERKREKVGKTIRGRKSVREQKRARKRDGKGRKAQEKSGLKYLQIDRKLHQSCSVKAHKDTIQ